MTATISCGGQIIGPGSPCFVIAEAGVNHDGHMDQALGLIDAAAAAGADAVKFQIFDPEALATAAAPTAAYQTNQTGRSSQLELLRQLVLPLDAWPRLAQHAQNLGLHFLCTPFDEGSLQVLLRLPLPAWKVPSGELTNLPWIRRLAGLGQPVILSTGMGTESEVQDAVRAIRSCGQRELLVLHCVSAYPAPPEAANLRAIPHLASILHCPVGWSDHTLNPEIPVTAVALGAAAIEKHITLDRHLRGPDHQASLEPSDFAAMVQSIRLVERALGTGEKVRTPWEEDVARVARRSLVSVAPLMAGTVLTPDVLTALRPGTGIPPSAIDQVIGRVLLRDIPAQHLLHESDLTMAPAHR